MSEDREAGGTALVAGRTRLMLRALPAGVELVLAAKKRTAAEINAALGAGARIVGQNYLQEAESIYPAVAPGASWHFIGRLQRNKVRKIVRLFDLVETVGSPEMAAEISRRSVEAGKVMPVLVEINSAGERGKDGVVPGEAAGLVREIARLPGLSVRGLMTMGPAVETPGEARPYFRLTRELAAEISRLALPGVSMGLLSMGMSDTWEAAVEEGATLVRVGTALFGPRPA